MAITTAMCNSFKEELLGGVHDLDTDTLKIALIKETPTGTYDANTTNYSDVTGNSDEAVGTNYTAGGQALDTATITLSGSTAFVDFADEVFTDLTILLMELSFITPHKPTKLLQYLTSVVQLQLHLVTLLLYSQLQIVLTLLSASANKVFAQWH